MVALVWANVDSSSYHSFWHTELSIKLGSHGPSYDLREWVNSGLMTFFFLVVGLETRREFDLGDLRERRRFLLPFAVGLVGMVVPALVFLAFNAGHGSEQAWGIAMSTDTALALGLLALIGREVPDRARVFLVTVFVVDDLAALAVIAFVYSDDITVWPIALAVVLYAGLLVAVRLRMQQRWLFLLLGVVIWSALMASGVDPLVAGLAIGLAAPAYTPSRGELEEATGRVRQFREEPTPELARTATAGLTSTLSPNARLQAFYHPWTSYVIVPLFALSNAGIGLDGDFLRHAYAAPVTLGVLVGYVVGKPIAVGHDLVGGHPDQRWPGAATDRLGGGDRQRHHLRDRLHRGPADRQPRSRRRRARPGQARCAVGRGRLGGADRGRLPARRPALARPQGQGPARRHRP